MTNRKSQFNPLNVDQVDELKDHYQAIKEWLVEQTERDIRHNIPNLVEAIAEASTDPETVQFIGGVSFTRNHTPLDYRLDRIYAPADVDFYRRTSVKQPISRDHHYVEFIYPPDPNFDGAALRATLLTAIETEIYSLQDDVDHTSPRSGLSSLWQDL